jgi:hypothetical protein
MVRAMRIACGLLLASVALARADDAQPTWTQLDNKQLGVHVRRPPRMTPKVAGSQLVLVGKDLPTVTIAVSTTSDRSTNKSGGVRDGHVEWTVAVPKRSARCTADATNDDLADIASHICDTLEVDPGPRSPHVELAVESSGLTDSAAYERAVRGKAATLDHCWKAALAKDANLPPGAVELRRTFDHGQAASTNESRENFFDHDAKALGACITGALKDVPVKTTEDAASIKITAVCQLY